MIKKNRLTARRAVGVADGPASGGETTLLVHWGRNGAGPRFLVRMAEAMSPVTPVVLSYNSDADVCDQLSACGLPELRVRTFNSRIGVVLGLPRLLVNALRFRRFIRRHRITTVISAMEAVYQSLAVPLAVPKDVRYLPIIHDAVEHPGDENPVLRLGRRLEYRRADRAIALSDTVAYTLSGQGSVSSDRIDVLYLPVFGAIASQPRELPTGDVIVGNLGRLKVYKGIDIFLAAVSRAREVDPSLRARVVGDGPEAALANSPDGRLADWQVGWIDDADLEPIMDSFDVLALPYREATQSAVLALGLARGVPIVVTPVGGLTAQLEHGGGLVAQDVTAEAVSAEIVRLCTDPALYLECSKAGLAAASRFSWETFAQELLSVIERV